jgi:hypothetical protein
LVALMTYTMYVSITKQNEGLLTFGMVIQVTKTLRCGMWLKGKGLIIIFSNSSMVSIGKSADREAVTVTEKVRALA